VSHHSWNLAKNEYDSADELFTDLGWKLPWVKATSDAQPVIDVNGNMTSGTSSRIWHPEKAKARAGIYDLTWTGSGTFLGTSGWSQNVSSTTGASPRTVTITSPFPTADLLLNFTGTITDLMIKHRDDAARTKILSVAAAARLGTNIIGLKATNLWRTNDANAMNAGSFVKQRTAGAYNWYHKLPTIELLIALANEADCELWVNVHHAQDDNWVTFLADRISASNTTRTILVELGDKVWDTTLPGNAYFGGGAKETWVPNYTNRARIVASTIDALNTVQGHFVSTTGSPSGDGTLNNPWDLTTALNHPAAVQPGDTIWLRGGTYTGGQKSYLTGNAVNEITVRSYPGELAKLDLWKPGQTTVEERGFFVYNDYVVFRDLELYMSDLASRITDGNYLTTPNPRPGQMYLDGIGQKLINNIIHDLTVGVLWEHLRGGNQGEMYGNIIYNIGSIARNEGGNPRGLGVGIYTSNNTATKFIRNNILFNQLGDNINVYSASPSGVVRYFDVDGNISFVPGGGVGQGGTPQSAHEHFTFGGVNPSDLIIRNNYSYSFNAEEDIFWTFGPATNITVDGNYLSSGYHYWHNPTTNLVATNNTLIGPLLGPNVPSTFSGQTNGNKAIATGGATGTVVAVRPNTYESGRGHIAIFNWGLANSVNVNLSSVLSVGQAYEIRHAYRLNDAPLLSGTYAGGTVSIPMQDTTAPALIGDLTPKGNLIIGPPIVLGKEFGAFVVGTPADLARFNQISEG
jgi:hypothetical protein